MCGLRLLPSPCASRLLECLATRRREVESDDGDSRRSSLKLRKNALKCLLEHQNLGASIGDNEELLGDSQPPVQRHQHRAKPRARIEQNQIVRSIQAQDCDAVPAADAELLLQCRRGALDARGERAIAQPSPPRRLWLSCPARTPRCGRSGYRGPPSVVRFAGLVQRLASDTVEAKFGGPGQHQRAAAAVAIDPLQRQ